MNLPAVIILFGLIGILFYELFMRLKVAGDIQQVFTVAPMAVRVIRSTTLSDEEKESSVRRMSLSVLKDTFKFTTKLIGILLVCIALAAIAQLLFKPSPAGLSNLLTSWQGLLAAVVVVGLYTHFKTTDQAGDPQTDNTQYSTLDRLLHRVAFIHPSVQKILGDVENDLFKKQLTNIEVTRPVFVTGLPRAGTTLLLELLYDTNRFASFTYRQMPFVLNPLLWSRLSASSRKHGEALERAHGDGMLISYDSPEAFEEVFWVNTLDKIMLVNGAIKPLAPADLDETTRETFVNLARKIVALGVADSNSFDGSGDTTENKLESKHSNAVSRQYSLRYLSKNNANLSRLAAIRSVFNDADLLLCYRHPSTHVASLHTQHLRFLEMHRDDEFTRSYMRWIGHHDFGANFHPIRFGNNIQHDPIERVFWLQYWIDAYRFVLEHAPAHTQFVGYESLLNNGRADLRQLASALGLDALACTELTAGAERLRAPTSATVELSNLSTTLAREAQDIYDELSARSIEQGYSGVSGYP